MPAPDVFSQVSLFIDTFVGLDNLKLFFMGLMAIVLIGKVFLR